MSNEKKLRLQQVAREFKVGFGTVVDFLARKGVNIDATPSTLIDGDTYALIEKEFGGTQRGGERANVRERMNLKQESVTLSNKKDNAPEEEEVVVKSTTMPTAREGHVRHSPRFWAKSTSRQVRRLSLSPHPRRRSPSLLPLLHPRGRSRSPHPRGRSLSLHPHPLSPR